MAGFDEDGPKQTKRFQSMQMLVVTRIESAILLLKVLGGNAG